MYFIFMECVNHPVPGFELYKRTIGFNIYRTYIYRIYIRKIKTDYFIKDI